MTIETDLGYGCLGCKHSKLLTNDEQVDGVFNFTCKNGDIGGLKVKDFPLIVAVVVANCQGHILAKTERFNGGCEGFYSD